jgi:hypothetical protein
MISSTPNSNQQSFAKQISNVLILSVLAAGLFVILGAYSSTANAVVRKPYFRVYGGNVVTGDCRTYSETGPTGLPRILGWNRTLNGGGAAGTHGVLSLGQVNEFASAAGRSATPIPLNGLTFANSGSAAGSYGGNLDAGYIHCIQKFFNVPSNHQVWTNSSFGMNNPGTESGVYYREGDLTLMGNYSDKNITLYVNGTVTVNGADVRNNLSSAGINNLENMPSLLVVARNIIIRHNISEVAGTFVAEPSVPGDPNEGTITTCDLGEDPSTEGITSHLGTVCDRRLLVHGSLIAERIKLFRSWGSYEAAENSERHNSDIPNDAAERIIYSPEVWLPNNSSGSKIQLKGTYDAFTAMPPIL